MKLTIRFLVCFLGNFSIYQTSDCLNGVRKRFSGNTFGCDKDSLQVAECVKISPTTSVSLLKDKNGRKCLIRQDVRDELILHISVARNKLGSFVAESVGVRANQVEIIPGGCDFPGKYNKKFPATLHTLAPGVLAKKLPKYSRVYIQQLMKPTISETIWGLTWRVLEDMVKHRDLCEIVALDTFIANADRHKGNFFYDEESDHYCAIDLESSFNKDLAIYACNFIELLLRENVKVVETSGKIIVNHNKRKVIIQKESAVIKTYRRSGTVKDIGKLIASVQNSSKRTYITVQELSALEVYRDVLKKLLDLHTSASLYQRLMEFVEDAGLVAQLPRSVLVGKMEFYKESIRQNYDSCRRLVYLLDQLLMKYS